ncbi:MAG TPA: PilN domain-containing protein [Aquabacterium sp.]|uniref:PilN domain-containing protein n=1 Tax=Aquabacterium sp. TaxID=1872578 RepID=UPI002E3154F7|nr:PilN domain-containing protein [Aquabacterium sp.]HEX5354937.1 PilN domain-containing protein [Aquabacterium sp.]
MILINLLPHREEKRQLRKQAFFVGVGVSVLAGGLIVAMWYAVQLRMMATQQTRNEILNSAIHKLDDEIKDVSALKAEIDSLKARQRAVEDLQTDRNMPVYLLNELVSQTPEGLYLTAIHQNGQTVTVSGFAQTNERVSEFLRNTNNKSTWLEHPELIEIKAATNNSKDARDNKRLFDFAMRVSLKRPGEVSSAASAASAPGAAASGVKPPQSAASAPVKSGA